MFLGRLRLEGQPVAQGSLLPGVEFDLRALLPVSQEELIEGGWHNLFEVLITGQGQGLEDQVARVEQVRMSFEPHQQGGVGVFPIVAVGENGLRPEAESAQHMQQRGGQ